MFLGIAGGVVGGGAGGRGNLSSVIFLPVLHGVVLVNGTRMLWLGGEGSNGGPALLLRLLPSLRSFQDVMVGGLPYLFFALFVKQFLFVNH